MRLFFTYQTGLRCLFFIQNIIFQKPTPNSFNALTYESIAEEGVRTR